MNGTVVFIFMMLVFSGCEKKSESAPPLPVVEVMEVTQKDIPVENQWIGITDGTVNAKIRAQVTGYLIKQCYTEGDFVKTGQILFEIDPSL